MPLPHISLAQSRVDWFRELVADVDQQVAEGKIGKYIAWSRRYWSWAVMLEALRQKGFDEADLSAETFDETILDGPLRLLERELLFVIHSALDQDFSASRLSRERGAISALNGVLPWYRANTKWKKIPASLTFSRPRSIDRLRHPLVERFLKRYSTQQSRQAIRGALATYLEFLLVRDGLLKGCVVMLRWAREYRATELLIRRKQLPAKDWLSETLLWRLSLQARISFEGYRRYLNRFPPRQRTVFLSAARVFQRWLFEEKLSAFDPDKSRDEAQGLAIVDSLNRPEAGISLKTVYQRRFYFKQFVEYVAQRFKFVTEPVANNSLWQFLEAQRMGRPNDISAEARATVTYQILFQAEPLIRDYYRMLLEREKESKRKTGAASAMSAVRRFFFNCAIPGVIDPFQQAKFLAMLRRAR